MHDFLSEDERVRKLLRSAQTALPLKKDVWGTLGQGLGLSPTELIQVFSRLLDEDILQGVWGEPNPALPPAFEFIECIKEPSPSPGEKTVERWRARRRDGQGWLVSRMGLGPREPGEWFSSSFLKIGYHADPTKAEGQLLLSPTENRTYLVSDRDSEFPELAPEEAMLAEEYFIPLPVQPDQGNFWEILGKVAAMGPIEARTAASNLILKRIWRRLALKVSPAKMGVNGCGIACWKLEEKELDRAANSLAGLAGTGDVAIRQPKDSWQYNLSALFLGWEEGRGEAAAREVAKQWGRDLALWLDLELL